MYIGYIHTFLLYSFVKQKHYAQCFCFTKSLKPPPLTNTILQSIVFFEQGASCTLKTAYLSSISPSHIMLAGDLML